MIAAGVFAGANITYRAPASYPDRVSATGGTPGTSDEGRALVTAITRIFPALTCGAALAAVMKASCTWPANRSASCCAPLL